MMLKVIWMNIEKMQKNCLKVSLTHWLVKANLILEYDVRRLILWEYLRLAKAEKDDYANGLSLFEKAINQIEQCKILRGKILTEELANAKG